MALQRTLVLNASTEPIVTVCATRAVVLVLVGRAALLEAENGVPGSDFAWPTVIQLHRQAPVPFRGPAAYSRRAVLERDHYRCGYCGRHADTIDHIVPVSRCGARTDFLNTVAACRPCNSRKADRTPSEAGLTLRVTPQVPGGIDAFVSRWRSAHPSWASYVDPWCRTARTIRSA